MRGLVAVSLAVVACSPAPPKPTQTLPAKSGPATFAISGREETAIEVMVPAPLPANAPLLIVFHGTGSEPAEVVGSFQLQAAAARYGVVSIAPRAGYRLGKHPADVDHELDSTGSSWNMWTADRSTNEDLRYVVALIAAAKATYGVDTSRVYVAGFSNGAFMSWFTAASLSDVIAGFAEASGGWTTDSCPTRYGADSGGFSFIAPNGPAGGAELTCASLYATTTPKFPSQCLPGATNLLRPPKPARVPFGYLAHYSGDDTVSVQWSCFLGDFLGTRGKTSIRYTDSDGTFGHSVPSDFIDRAWAFFANRTNSQ